MRLRLIAWLVLAASFAHAAGTVQQSVSKLGNTENWVLTFNWTGDAITGTVPVTAAGSGNQDAQRSVNQLQGYLITQVETVPLTPNPTAGYSVALNDAAGVDMIGGSASSLSASTAQSFTITGGAPMNGVVSLTITGQSVAGAKGIVYVFLQKPGTVSLAQLLGNGSLPLVVLQTNKLQLLPSGWKGCIGPQAVTGSQGFNCPNYPLHLHASPDPVYPPMDVYAVFARSQQSGLASPGTAQQVVAILHDFNGNQGTPFPFFVQLHTTGLTSSNGAAASYVKILKDATATDIEFASHGECFQSGVGTCAAGNFEVHQVANAAGTIYGVIGNVVADALGTAHTATTFHAIANYPNGGTNPGGGMDILLNTGTHTFGLKVADNGGQATYPIAISTQTVQNPGTHLAIINAFAGTGQAQGRIGFFRGAAVNEIARITSDISVGGSFAAGFLKFATATGGVITDAIKLDENGDTHQLRSSFFAWDTPTHFTNLALLSAPNGSFTYCDDCTIANPCAGSGTGAFAKRLNGVFVCN